MRLRLIASLSACVFAASFALSANAQTFQPSNSINSVRYQGEKVMKSDELAELGFAIKTEGLDVELTKSVTYVRPIVEFVRLPRKEQMSSRDLVFKVVQDNATQPFQKFEPNHVLLVVGRGEYNALPNLWQYGVQVSPELQQFAPEADVAKILEKAAARHHLSNGATSIKGPGVSVGTDKADPSAFALDVETDVADLIASNGGPGHSNHIFLWLLALAAIGGGAYYYRDRLAALTKTKKVG
jgi:hypothetical protein